MTTLPWGVSFPHGSYPFAAQAKLGLIDPLTPFSLAIHPVQLYGSLKGLTLFFLFTAVWKRYRAPAGLLFCLYWMAFSVVRFGLEFFRGDVGRGFIGAFSTGQLMASITFICCGIILVYAFKVKRLRFMPRQAVALSQPEGLYPRMFNGPEGGNAATESLDTCPLPCYLEFVAL